MEFQNPDRGQYFLRVDVLKDIDCESLSMEIDNKRMILPISNQGQYALYLGEFHTCKFEKNDACAFSLQLKKNSYEEAIEVYSLSLLEVIEENVSFEELYLNLPQEPTERIYRIFRRLLSLIKLSILHGDDLLKKKTLIELDLQLKKEYPGTTNYVGNWWVYEIGVPRCLNEILFLCYKDFSLQDICHLMAIENFYIPQPEYEYYRRNYPNVKRFKTDYANLADNIYICLLRSILIQDATGIQKIISLLPQILKLTEQGNGFYKDGSFLYHSIIPYNAAYGEVLLHSVTKIILLFNLLKINIDDYIDILYERIETSYLPFIYHQRALECVRGRSVSRRADCHYSFNRILQALKGLAKFFSKKDFLEKIHNEEEVFQYSPQAFAYNYMNRYIKRNNDYLIAISSCSDSVANYESINGENLLGYYQSNFTFDLYYNQKPIPGEVLWTNPFYRNGSTNSLRSELPNQIMKNKVASGVAYQELLNTCFHQTNDVEGYFSKFVLKNSLVAVGTNIASQYDYVSTLYCFNDDFTFDKNGLETKNIKLLYNQEPVIEQVDEIRSFHDLNENERDEPVQIRQTRVYLKSPKEYSYQLYPNKNSIQDEYQLYHLPNAHILRYENFLMINSFVLEDIQFENIRLRGCASWIFVFNKDEIEVYFSATPNQKISVKIDGFVLENSDSKKDEYIFDKLEHKLIFRRSL